MEFAKVPMPESLKNYIYIYIYIYILKKKLEYFENFDKI
jgi:hypothetical protein